MLKETPKIKWDWNCLDVVAKFFSLSNTIDLNSLKLDIIHTSEKNLQRVKTPCKVSKDGWFVVFIPASDPFYDYEVVVGIDLNAPFGDISGIVMS